MVRVDLDLDKPVQYLGGWSSGRARDNLCNDNFGAFAVHLKSESFHADQKEIFEARWFDWKVCSVVYS